ncbi:type IV pilus biogenesis protein PilP [Pantoea sp. BS_8]|uniref:type IV pilus biogenesis protein PilP n=1 Tax=Pantoea sp. BS_8 TaxID=3055781 RepID=UPI0035C098F3
MRRNSPAVICLLLSWTLMHHVQAADSGSLPPNVTLGELESAQAQNLLLEQRVQTARLQQQLRESLAPVTSAPALSAVVPPLSSYPQARQMPSSSSQVKESSLASPKSAGIRLVEIYGKPGQLRARLLLPSGGIAEVVKGDPVPGTSKRVTAVTETVVRLSDDTELSF